MHAALTKASLGEDYYRLQQLDPHGVRGVAARPRGNLDYRYLDTSAFREAHCERLGTSAPSAPSASGAAGGARYRTSLGLDGLSCVACTWLIEELASREAGVARARVDLLGQRVELEFGEEASLERLAKTLGGFGYAARLVTDERPRRGQRALLDLALAGAAALNVMLLSLPNYAGLSEGRLALLFGWLSCGISALVLVGPTRSIFKGALAALSLGRVHLDLPLALGLGAAFLISFANLVQGAHEQLYFDTLCMLAFAILVGRFLQARAVDRARARVGLLGAELPGMVYRMRAGGFELVAPEELQAGDIVRMDSGQRLPRAGVLLEASTELDLSVVTGESLPRKVEIGKRLPVGVRALDVPFLVRVCDAVATEPDQGTDSRGAAVEKTPAASMLQRPRPPASPQGSASRPDAAAGGGAQRLATIWTLSVLGVAVLGFVLWRDQGVGAALEIAILILVVACPCAIGLGVPLVRASATALAARAGVLVRDPGGFDRLTELKSLVFDKTGTLSEGRPRICSEFFAADLGAGEKQWVLQALIAAEQLSIHPMAQSICAHFESSVGEFPEKPSKLVVRRGHGLRARIGNLELEVLPAREWPAGAKAPTPDAQHFIEQTQARAESCACVWTRELSAGAVTSRESSWKLQLVLGMQDRLRPEVKQTLDWLRQAQGLSLWMVSGDQQVAVHAAARALGLDAHRVRGEASPEDKADLLTALCAQGGVAMIGDGLNDLEAFSQAALAIAVGAAAPMAIKKCDVLIQGTGLWGVAELLRLGKQARFVNRINIAFALLYNLTGVGLVLTGFITPLLAALMMPLSSLTVISVSLLMMGRPSSRAFTPPIEAAIPAVEGQT